MVGHPCVDEDVPSVVWSCAPESTREVDDSRKNDRQSTNPWSRSTLPPVGHCARPRLARTTLAHSPAPAPLHLLAWLPAMRGCCPLSPAEGLAGGTGWDPVNRQLRVPGPKGRGGCVDQDILVLQDLIGYGHCTLKDKKHENRLSWADKKKGTLGRGKQSTSLLNQRSRYESCDKS